MIARLTDCVAYAVAILALCATAGTVQAADDTAAVVERWSRRSRRSSLSSKRHRPRAAPTSCRPRIASPPSIRTARSGSSIRSTRRRCSRSIGCELAPKHPEWKNKEPFKSVLAGDRAAMAKFTEEDWTRDHRRHPRGDEHRGFPGDRARLAGRRRSTRRFKRPYTELVYQPMIEVMAYLRANGFKTYIVTGGGQEFVRVYSEHVYGIPPEQVVGSSIATKYQMKDGKPVLMRQPKRVLHRRSRRQGDRHQPVHRQAAARRLRQLRRRSRDAGMDTAGDGARLACWCCTTTPSASTPTAPPTACPTPRSARSPRR